jgi:hypothetical protein
VVSSVVVGLIESVVDGTVLVSVWVELNGVVLLSVVVSSGEEVVVIELSVVD